MELRERLEEKRRQEGVSQRQFAKRLRISPSLYTLIQQDKRDVSTDTLAKIVRVFPELQADVLFFLSHDDRSKR